MQGASNSLVRRAIVYLSSCEVAECEVSDISGGGHRSVLDVANDVNYTYFRIHLPVVRPRPRSGNISSVTDIQT